MPPSSPVLCCIACVFLPSLFSFWAFLDTAILSYPPVQFSGTIIDKYICSSTRYPYFHSGLPKWHERESEQIACENFSVTQNWQRNRPTITRIYIFCCNRNSLHMAVK